MSSPFLLMFALIAGAGLYLDLVATSYRASRKRSIAAPWLLLLLSAAAIVGLTLALKIPVSPPSTLFTRLLALLDHLFNIVLIWAITSRIVPSNRLPGTLLYALNPLILIELAVYGDTAWVVITLLLLVVVLLLAGAQSEPLRRGGGRVDEEWGPLRSPFSRNHRLYEIAALVLLGLAMRINLMTLLVAPLLVWFMVRHNRSLGVALRGIAWQALVVLAVFVVAYIPAWHGIATFLAITDTIHLFDFTNSPLSLLVGPVRSLFKFVARNGHFPPSLMQPDTAADMTVIATSFFLFALVYVREMGKMRTCFVGAGIHGGTRAAQAPPPTASSTPAPTEIIPPLCRGGSGWDVWWGRLRRPRALSNSKSIQSKEVNADSVCKFDALFTGLAVVFLAYIVLAVTVFWPGYIVWGVWVVALRRFDALSVCLLLLSCSALLYYPLQQLAPAAAGIMLPVCVFGVPLVYLSGQRFVTRGKSERKNVLT